jgi:hypothetical protein
VVSDFLFNNDPNKHWYYGSTAHMMTKCISSTPGPVIAIPSWRRERNPELYETEAKRKPIAPRATMAEATSKA